MNNISTADLVTVAKLLGIIGSHRDAEALAAARKAHHLVQARGATGQRRYREYVGSGGNPFMTKFNAPCQPMGIFALRRFERQENIRRHMVENSLPHNKKTVQIVDRSLSNVGGQGTAHNKI